MSIVTVVEGQSSESGSDDETAPFPIGSALPNTLTTTLSLFPLAESRKVGKKRPRNDDTTTVIPVTDLLFPSEDDLLADSFDRALSIPHPQTKRRKTVNTKLELLIQKITPPKKVRAKFSTKLLIGNPQLMFPPQNIPESVKPPMEYTYMVPNEFNVRLVAPYVMYSYQLDTVKWMVEHEEGQTRIESWEPQRNGGLLAMAMGLGKTPTSACLIARTLNLQRIHRSCSLYVCPKNLLGTVRFQFEKFFGNQMRILIYHRDFLRSEFDAFDEHQIRKYDVIITNYSTIVSRMAAAGKTKVEKKKKTSKASAVTPEDAAILKKLGAGGVPVKSAVSFCEFHWFRIILDESHEIREKNTQKFRSVVLLNSPRRFCLTGTPICNKLADLFHQLEFTGLILKRGCKTNKQTMVSLDLLKMILFKDHKDAECVKLPPKVEHKIYFDLSPEERFMHNFYTKSAQNVYKQLESQVGRERSKKAFEVTSSCFRLMQVCSAPYLVTPAAKDHDSSEEDMSNVAAAVVFPGDEKINSWLQDRSGTAGIHSTKMNTFVNLIESLQKLATPKDPLKIVIFANYTCTLRLAIAALIDKQPEYTKKHIFIHGGINNPYKREELYTQFRVSDQIECLFMTLKLGSIGLNLSEANKVIFLESWYSYSALSQGACRVYRIGQQRPVDIYYLLAKESIEERVYRIAMNKKEMAEDVMSQSESKLDTDKLKQLLFDMEIDDVSSSSSN